MADSGVIHGVLDGIANDAKGLQEISDMQGQLMHNLSNTCESLVPALRGQAGMAMQAAGQRLEANGLMFSSQFADQSSMMQNNGAVMDSTDQDNSHIISQVNELT